MPRLSLRKRSSDEIGWEAHRLREAIAANGGTSLSVNYTKVQKLRRVEKALRARWSEENFGSDDQSTSVSDSVSSFEYEKEEAYERAMKEMAELAEQRERARELLYNRERMVYCDVDIASQAVWKRRQPDAEKASDDRLTELIE